MAEDKKDNTPFKIRKEHALYVVLGLVSASSAYLHSLANGTISSGEQEVAQSQSGLSARSISDLKEYIRAELSRRDERQQRKDDRRDDKIQDNRERINRLEIIQMSKKR